MKEELNEKINLIKQFERTQYEKTENTDIQIITIKQLEKEKLLLEIQ